MNNTATARAVTIIPATINLRQQNILNVRAKPRVAGYARVSTDSEEQLTSYEAQVDVFTKRIKENPEWEFAGIYADRDRSGISTKRRDEFNRLITDALAGKIDLILTKSVSRFARNTVDSLITVRQLKERGVEVYFEKENIYTFDSKGELLITIMSSLAQEESRSISENVTWGQRKRFADGKVSMPYKHFLGYQKGENMLPEIVESEAAVVRQIYAMFLQGKTAGAIAAHLTESGIPTPSKQLIPWSASTVMSILRNEKYSGNAILQKKYTVDFLTKKQKINEGEVPQVYVENSHPAIISPEVYEMVQAEIKRRQAQGGRHSSQHCFSGRLVCSECGGIYGSKVWQSNTKYRRIVWQCNKKFSQGTRCKTPHLTDEDIKQLFVDTFNRFYTDRANLNEDYEEIIAILADTKALETKAKALTAECAVIWELLQKCVSDNAHTVQNQKAYNEKYDGLVKRHKTVKSQLDVVHDEIRSRAVKREGITRFLADLNKFGGPLEDFDESLWYATVDTVTIGETSATFAFKDDTVIETRI